MKRTSVLIAGLLCGAWSMFPALGDANQDLEVTMEVIDNISQLDGVVAEMPGPEVGEFDEERDEQSREERSSEQSSRKDGSPDPFEYDDMDDEAHQRALQSEDDFEESEDVDDEHFEIEEEDDQTEEDEHPEA